MCRGESPHEVGPHDLPLHMYAGRAVPGLRLSALRGGRPAAETSALVFQSRTVLIRLSVSQEESLAKTTYAANSESMLRSEYTVAFWVATKVGPLPTGI